MVWLIGNEHEWHQDAHRDDFNFARGAFDGNELPFRPQPAFVSLRQVLHLIGEQQHQLIAAALEGLTKHDFFRRRLKAWHSISRFSTVLA